MRNARADFGALISLRWRQFRDDARYWLRVLGYQPNDESFAQKMYVFYLALIALIWLYTVGGWVLQQTYEIGSLLTRSQAGDLLILVSYIPLIGLVLALSAALRSTPLKLTFPDIAYVAGSPIIRAAPVLVGFVRFILLRVAIVSGLVIIVSVLINRSLFGTVTVQDVMRGLSVAFVLTVMTYALAWFAGIARLAFPRLKAIGPLWLAPGVLLLAVVVAPDAALWSGRAMSLALIGEAPGWVVLVFAGTAMLLLIGLGLLSRRMDMIQASDESQLFARLQAIGLLRYTQPRTQARIRAQAARARRRAFFSLKEATGWNGLVSRAVLSYLRHPLSLVSTVIWAALMTVATADVILNQRPAQLWIGLAIVAGLRPPGGLLYVFEQDVEEPFLRQFLPVSTVGLLAADALLPFMLMIGTSIVVWILVAPSADILLLGIPMIFAASAVIGFCGAFGATRVRRFESRFFATLIALGAAMGIGSALGSPLASLLTMIVTVMLLGGWISSES